MKMLDRQTDRQTLSLSIVYGISFLFILTMLIIKCHYGFSDIDESFYLTIPYRLFQGDGLFVQEWHLSQMSGLLLYPILKLYMGIFNTTEGMVLAFRYIYVAINALTALFVFFRCKPYNVIGAAFSSLALFIFAPMGIMALSYNSLGIITLVISTVILLTSQKRFEIQYFLSGVFFALSVLCCPFLVLLFLIYSLIVLIVVIFQRRKELSKSSILRVKNWLFFVFGIVFSVLIFVVFVLSRNSMSSIVMSFQYILQDPQHSGESFIEKIISYCNSLLIRPFIYLYGFILLFYFIERGKKINKSLYFCSIILITLVFICNLAYRAKLINVLMLPLNYAGFICSVLFFSDERIRRVFYTLWIPGFVYSISIHFTSNQNIYAISCASTVSVVGSILVICMAIDLLSFIKAKIKQLLVMLTILMLFTQIGSELFYRMFYIYWSEPIYAQIYYISEGYEKGLYVDKTNYNRYIDTLQVTKEIEAIGNENDEILYLSDDSFLYLMTKKYKNASYSAWPSGIDAKRINAYYLINPQKIPDYIFVRAKDDDTIMDEITIGNNYKKSYLSNGDHLYYREDN